MSTEGTRWPEGVHLVTLDEVDSTMAEAARRVPDLTGPTWITARRQSGGHGRQGRPWIMPEGNLAATLVFRPWATPHEAAKRSFLAACALHQALALVAPGARLQLKWPNDVLLNGGKVAGILLESASSGPLVDWLAIGIGVNLAASPAVASTGGSAEPVNLRRETGVTVTPRDFLTLLADAYATQEAKLAAFGFARIREDWLAHAARLGDVIVARTARGEHVGVFETVDLDGNLCLATGEGMRIIPAADVYF
ncbi:MAG: biotin--[acetyl-CoA-carboxylase] ligase [Rubellimicrobium sp.]|nr:biotin--[acetyl-CoA-carboxylase] ligase [Rubellimicrobium sp.]